MGRLDGKVALDHRRSRWDGPGGRRAVRAGGRHVAVVDVIDASDTVIAVREKMGDAIVDPADAGDPRVRVETRWQRGAAHRSATSTCSTTTPASASPTTTARSTRPSRAWDDDHGRQRQGRLAVLQGGHPGDVSSGGGSIINVASFVAHMGAATPQLAYTTSKGAVLAMTREIAVIYARQGIRVNALCPGPVLTPLLAKFLSDEEKRQRRLVHIPMGRFGEAEEMVKGALFLASRRLLVHDRPVAHHRRRHHRHLRDPRVSEPSEPRGRLTPDELRAQVAAGAIDTVLVAFPDLQGRLVGKRVTGHLLRRHGARRAAIEACNYLLAVDVDMNPLPGYRFANWDQGYGDFSCRPRPRRRCDSCPWLERHRARAVRPGRRARAARRSRCRPARCSATRSSGPPRRSATSREDRHRARVLPLPATPSRSWPGRTTATSSPHSDWIEDYHILQTSRGGVPDPRDPQRHGRRRHPGRVLQGRGGLRPARDQPGLRRGARDGRPPRRSTRTA